MVGLYERCLSSGNAIPRAMTGIWNGKLPVESISQMDRDAYECFAAMNDDPQVTDVVLLVALLAERPKGLVPGVTFFWRLCRDQNDVAFFYHL